jgi:hypothetical protein
MRSNIIRAMLVWLALSLAGAVVVALPDDGQRVFTLSETHGPSAVDLAGVILLMLGWLIFLAALWRVRHSIRSRSLIFGAAAVGAAIVAWSILTDAGWWWVLGVAILVAAQVWAAISAATAPADC